MRFGGSTRRRVEPMLIPAVFQRNSEPSCRAPSRCARETLFCHRGQESIWVSTNQTRSRRCFDYRALLRYGGCRAVDVEGHPGLVSSETLKGGVRPTRSCRTAPEKATARGADWGTFAARPSSVTGGGGMSKRFHRR